MNIKEMLDQYFKTDNTHQEDLVFLRDKPSYGELAEALKEAVEGMKDTWEEARTSYEPSIDWIGDWLNKHGFKSP